LSFIDRLSKLFHCLNQENIYNNTVTKDPTTPQVCRYTIFVKCHSDLKETIEYNTISVITFQEISNRNMFIVSVMKLSNVTAASCSFNDKCSMCIRLAAGRRTLKSVVTEVVLFSIVAFKTLTFHKVV